MSFFEKIIGQELDARHGDPVHYRVVICTLPRTAGHTFCTAMQALGWGVPTEYFFPDFALNLYRRWVNPSCIEIGEVRENAAQYGRELLRHRSNNGIFSVKIFPNDLEFMRHAIGDDAANTFYIHLSRKDLVSQTVSLASVLLTGRPFNSDEVLSHIPKLFEAEPTRASLENLLVWLKTQESFWATFLEDVPASRVIRLYTEDFLISPHATMQRVAAQFGLKFEVSHMLPEIVASGAYATDRSLKTRIMSEHGQYLNLLTCSSA